MIQVGQALDGLTKSPKTLPTWLLYDEAGCAIYERITETPEYYLTRAETDAFVANAEAIVDAVSEGATHVSFIEIGAGTATKTEILLGAAVGRQVPCSYLACDIAPEPLDAARERIAERLPRLAMKTFAGTHRQARGLIADTHGRQVVLFIGSSIGNYADDDAIALLRDMRPSLRDDAIFIIGTDLKKDPRLLESAYDDAGGVTAEFTLNVLTRLNREWSCDFDRAKFRHRAVWNEDASNVEIYIEATSACSVSLLDGTQTVTFERGERVLLEISAKYDEERIAGILARSGFELRGSFLDSGGRYAVQLARLVR